MSEYGRDYWDVLKLPLSVFWGLNRQVDRLRAERDTRELRLLSAAQAPEAAQQLSQRLREELGQPVVVEKKFDADKFEELAARFSQQRVGTYTHTPTDGVQE